MATNRTMYLHHVTLDANWSSIALKGLLMSYSLRQREKIGLVTSHRLRWAVLHFCEKHQVRPEHCIVVRVRVRRHTLRRNRLRGVWYSIADIPASRIEHIAFYIDDYDVGDQVGKVCSKCNGLMDFQYYQDDYLEDHEGNFVRDDFDYPIEIQNAIYKCRKCGRMIAVFRRYTGAG